MNFAPVSSYPRQVLKRALADGHCVLGTGCFEARVTGRHHALVDHLRHQYHHVPMALMRDRVTDMELVLGAPNLLRRWIRPQVIFNPGFVFPVHPLPAHMAPLAMEMGLNLCVALDCASFLVVHAGVVARQDQAVMLTGASGAGKSTLTALLMEEGYRLLSDEFGLIDSGEDGQVRLQAYPRPVSLKNESINLLRDRIAGEGLSRQLIGTPKGNIAFRRPRQSDIADARPARPAVILFPTFEAGSGLSVTPIPPPDAALTLIQSSPNYQLMGEEGFAHVMDMVSAAPAFQVTYGDVRGLLPFHDDHLAGGRP